jgi:hypothetical protein
MMGPLSVMDGVWYIRYCSVHFATSNSSKSSYRPLCFSKWIIAFGITDTLSQLLPDSSSSLIKQYFIGDRTGRDGVGTVLSGRENKNRYVFAYISHLIQRKVFKTVFVSFLPKVNRHSQLHSLSSTLSQSSHTLVSLVKVWLSVLTTV